VYLEVREVIHQEVSVKIVLLMQDLHNPANLSFVQVIEMFLLIERTHGVSLL
jgi:hypothetical protein